MKSILISVSKGRFKSVEQAAVSEKKINWFEPDANRDAVTECFAAVELKNHLSMLYSEAGGKAPQLILGSGGPDGRKVDVLFVLGTRQSHPQVAAAERRLRLSSIRHDGCVIACEKQAGVKTVIIAGKNSKGVLNGVYRYLEELGVVWNSPDSYQAVWPSRVRLWQEGMIIRESPDFELRGYYSEVKPGLPEKTILWLARNRFNMGKEGKPGFEFSKKLGMRVVTGGHVFPGILDPDYKPKKGVKLFDRHPEWFAMRDGERKPRAGYICTANSGAVKFFTERAAAEIVTQAAKADAYRFWAPDCWGEWCECKRCAAMGNATDRYLYLVHRLRKELDRLFRKGVTDHRINILFAVYEGTDSYDPPSKPLPGGFDSEMNWAEMWPINRCYAHAQSDPACREFNLHYNEALKGWRRRFHGRIIMGEYYNVSQYYDMATVFSRVMEKDIRDYHEYGLAGLQYMHLAPEHWGSRALTNWQLGALAWNSRRQYPQFTMAFFRARYGSLATRVTRQYGMLDAAMSNLSAIKSWMAGSISHRLRHCYGLMKADRSTENLFVYDHLGLHRPAGKDNKIGYGLNNFDDIMKNLLKVKNTLREMRRTRGIPQTVRDNLAEDIRQVEYTIDMLGIHYEFCRFWECNRLGKGDAREHKRLIMKLAKKLKQTEMPGRTFQGNALENTGLMIPLCVIGCLP